MVKVWDKINKIKDFLYFVRIDFRLKDMDDEFKYYIGRFVFDYEDEFIIFDWCFLIVSMFYDYEIGKVGYDVLIGWVDGEIIRKW